MKKFLIVPFCLLGLVMSRPASADTLYNLSNGNSGISGSPGPYGYVDVQLSADGKTATISFNAEQGYLFGGQGAMGVNVNATDYTVNGLTGDKSNGGSNNEDGFGVFNTTVDNFDGFGHAFSSFSFTITLNSGTWASDANVLTANSSGETVAAHIFIPNAAGTGATATGYAADGPGPVPTGVPDGGSTAALLGSALVGVGMLRRRFGKA